MGLVLLSAVPLVCALRSLIFSANQVERAVLHWMKVDPLLKSAWPGWRRVARYCRCHWHNRPVAALPALLLRPLPRAALALRLARRLPGHRPLASPPPVSPGTCAISPTTT